MRLLAVLTMIGLAIGGFFAEYLLFESALPRLGIAFGVFITFGITIGCISYLARHFLGERTVSDRTWASDAER